MATKTKPKGKMSMTDFGSGGRLPGQNRRVRFSNCRVEVGQYTKKTGEKVGKPKTFFMYDGEVLDPIDDDEITEYNGMLDVGPVEHFQPSEDGETAAESGPFVAPVGDYPNIWPSTPYALFTTEALNLGFDPELLNENGVAAFDDQVFLLEAFEVPLGKNAPKGTKPMTILVPAEIIDEDEKPKGKTSSKGKSSKAKGGKTSKAKAKADADESDEPDAEVEETAKTAVLSVLEDEPVIEKKALVQRVYKIENSNPNRSEILKLVNSDEWLGSQDEFSYEDGTITAA